MYRCKRAYDSLERSNYNLLYEMHQNKLAYREIETKWIMMVRDKLRIILSEGESIEINVNSTRYASCLTKFSTKY